MTSKDRVEYCLKQIKKIKDQQTVLHQHRQLSMDHYDAKPSIVKVIKGCSEVTTTDFADTVEQVKSYILNTLVNEEEIVLPPETPEDVPKMEALQLLVNKHIRVKNNWYLILNDFLDDVLKFKFGAIKYQYVRNVTHVYKEIFGLSEMEFKLKMMEPDVELVEVNMREIQPESVDEMGMPIPAVSEYDITIRIPVEDEYTLLEAVPSEDIGFPLDAREIDEVFFYHRVSMPEWKVRRFYGEEVLKKLKKMKNRVRKDDPDSIKSERLRDLGGYDFLYSDKKDEFVFYECYYPDLETGIPHICLICGEEEVKYERNKYGRVPFRVATPIKMGHLVVGKDLLDLMREFHKIRTELLRQIFGNTYRANFRRYFVDYTRVNREDYLNNNVTNAMIRVEGDPNTAVRPEDKAPIAPEIFQLWEMLGQEKDYHSTVPRAFTGVNPRVMNKTYRGQAQQVSLAAQKLDMMTMIIVQMAIAPLIVDVANCIIQFMKKKTWVRHLNEFVEINPDNLVTKADHAIINVGLGTQHKDMVVAHIQQLLAIYAQVFKLGIPVVSPDNVYHALGVLIKAMRFKDVDNFRTQPKFMELVTGLIQQLQAFAVQLQQMGVPIDPQLMQTVMELMRQLGMQPPMPQSPQDQGLEGMNRPEQAVQPTQPINPRLQPDMAGGNFWA